MSSPEAALRSEDITAIQALARSLERDGDVLFITGAGLSADSGLPTYRGVGGLYADRDAEESMSIEEALSAAVFQRRPDITWKHIHRVAKAGAGAVPNRGHQVIAALSARLPRVVVLTQNVDGLHEAAGSPDVIAIHGDVGSLACTDCSWSTLMPDLDGLPPVPRCPVCASVTRPPVVLFEEMLPASAVERYHAELSQGFGVVVSVGTSGQFPYITAPVRHIQASGGLAAEINPEPTSLSPVVDLRIRAGAALALGHLGQLMGLG